MDKQSDKVLLTLIRQDDRQAFLLLVDRYSDILFRYVSRRTKSLVDTQDILQEIYISFWKKRHQIELEDSAYAYLFQSARYETINWLIKKDRAIARQEMLVAKAEREAPACDEEFLAEELYQLVEEEVERMPKTMKTVFRLSRRQYMSVGEIALHLMLSEQTVKNNISMALGRLKSKLQHEYLILVLSMILLAI